LGGVFEHWRRWSSNQTTPPTHQNITRSTQFSHCYW
jgi:hypothetical protein